MAQNNSSSPFYGTDTLKLDPAITISISVTIVIVNAIPICIISCIREIRKVMSNKFLLNLLMSHFVVGVLYLFTITLQFMQARRTIVHIIHAAAEIIATSSMIALTIDRCLCIKYPFQYQNFPKWISYLLMFFCWLIGIIIFICGAVSSVYIMMIYNVRVMYAITGTIAVVVLLVSNTLIFIETRRHIKAISAVSVAHRIESTKTTAPAIDFIACVNPDNVEDAVNSIQTNDLYTKSSRELKKRFIQKKEIRAAHICILMATSYIFLWVPYFVASYVGTNTMSYLAFSIYIGMINSVADPLIYVRFNKKVKTVVVNQVAIVFEYCKCIYRE